MQRYKSVIFFFFILYVFSHSANAATMAECAPLNQQYKLCASQYWGIQCGYVSNGMMTLKVLWAKLQCPSGSMDYSSSCSKVQGLKGPEVQGCQFGQ